MHALILVSRAFPSVTFLAAIAATAICSPLQVDPSAKSWEVLPNTEEKLLLSNFENHALANEEIFTMYIYR